MKKTGQERYEYVRSSPRFFRLITASGVLFAAAVLAAAFLAPAPLQEPADAGAPPNPAKSAWFLLWIQEVVSHGTYLIYPCILFGLLFLVLPWLPLGAPLQRASWLPREQWPVNLLTLAVFAALAALTLVAAFFRGPMWAFTSPF